MKTVFATILCFLLSSYTSPCATYVYDYNSNCSKAYEHYMAMRFGEANALLIQEIRSNPYNLIATYLGDYEECLTLLFTGDKAYYEQRKNHIDERLELLSKGNENEPWYRLCKAGVNLHWALVYVRMGENLKAAVHFRRSFILLKENKEKFPAFDYNNVFFGLEQAAVGAVPEEYKWVASVFGMKGDVKKGVAAMASFINKHHERDLLRDEAVVFYAYLKFYLMSQHEEAWNFVNDPGFSVQNNLLHVFVKANIALNYRKADAALQLLKGASTEKNYNKYPVLDYELGNALQHKLDMSCIGYYRLFLDRYHGEIFIKETWQKLSLLYYMQGNMPQANYCKAQVKKQGTTQVDADKQAQRSAQNDPWPNVTLLQARLLTDGGFYELALQKMGGSKETSYKGISEQLEYNFRMGRIYDELNNDSRALEYYNRAIKLGKTRPEHFAARSALQMGFMYERLGKTQEAVASYQECLSMRGHDFQSAIDQQAKAGVNRLTLR